MEPNVTDVCVPNDPLPRAFETAGIHRLPHLVREHLGVVFAAISTRPEKQTLLALRSPVVAQQGNGAAAEVDYSSTRLRLCSRHRQALLDPINVSPAKPKE